MDHPLNFSDYQHLERSSLFQGIGIESMAAQLTACDVAAIEAGRHLLEPGEVNRAIYILLAGELRVYLDGLDMPVHAVLGAGDCVGEMSLVDGQPASALVVAETACRLLVIPHPVVWSMVESSHGIARNLLAILSGRVRNNNLTLVAAQTRSLEFEQASSVDLLTGLHNRRWLEAALPRVLHRCDRDGHAACLLLADIDGLDGCNEDCGHAAGDAALRLVGARLAEGLRAQDLLARHGADEFVILLPRTEIDEGLLIAERLRDRVSGGVPLDTPAGPRNLAISGGIAAHVRGEALDQLVARATVALRAAKDAGGDRVELAR